MAEKSLADRFLQNPLEFLDRAFPSSGGIVQTGAKEFCLGNISAARAVLLNRDKLYEEDSDFFHTRRGLFGPREAQLKIRRDSRALLREFLDERGREALSSFVMVHLPAETEWPDAGNRLVYRYLRPVLLAPDSPPRALRLLDDIVERAVLRGSGTRRAVWGRMILQFRATLRLSGAIEARQAAARAQPLDMLDVVAGAAEHGHSSADLVDVFLAFVFSIAGSVGFLLGWSVFLWGTHPDCEVPPEWVVLEALRLWPVAWKLTRRPARDHEVSGVHVGTGHTVAACPYLVHRNPDNWSQAAEFRPERWATPESRRNPAFIPFGYGPHQCVAADLSTQLVGNMLEAIRRDNTLAVSSRGRGPLVGPAMAPPPYRLTLSRRCRSGGT